MAKAIAKYIRMSPRKLRRVVNVIRGKDVTSAKVLLKFMPYRACEIVTKVLNSAIANAKENEKLSLDELKITKAFVDQAQTLRRWRAMSRGRAYPILKRTSHVTIEVAPDLELIKEKESLKLERKPQFKKEAARQTEDKKEAQEKTREEKELKRIIYKKKVKEKSSAGDKEKKKLKHKEKKGKKEE